MLGMPTIWYGPTSPFPEIVLEFVRFDNVASAIVNTDHSIVSTAVKLRVTDCVADRVGFAIPQSTERRRIGN
jgi:hypothetical protein